MQTSAYNLDFLCAADTSPSKFGWMDKYTELLCYASYYIQWFNQSIWNYQLFICSSTILISWQTSSH